MANANASNLGHSIKTIPCGLSQATAAGTGDNTAVTGATIDRLGYESARLVVSYKTTLTASQTLSFAVAYQESDDGSSWDTAVALQAATVAKTGALTNELGDLEFDLNLGARKRYIRFNFTPDLSHSGTDTFVASAVVILGGAVVKPAA